MPDQPRWLNDAERHTWMELVRVMTRLPAALDTQLRRDSKLTQYEYLVLGVLAEQPDHRLGMKALAAVTNGSLSRLSHVVKRLEAAGCLRRDTDPCDGRLTRAELTPKGLRIVRAAAPGHVAAVRQHVFGNLSKKEVSQLGDLLGRIAQECNVDADG
ncbi:MarR family transcriptional regulator [Candidatus Mycobacterium wuenschmannii]|uniref:MarR family transcriptional regulator n=1 Tax=Candidatus Mycobacterium wuenschmannii TaxID=3027808 RepID=A0ABY8VUI9_9MYCO|nr:MarR family transcriptional regulator [Candidatus Mycobacterium wuenschmannii]WIM85807.1 MarR family transcriptional regulator [Candidatus Mycobacterium wuenschmannii]